MEIAFLIGSGLSISVGLPNIKQITNAIYPVKVKDTTFNTNGHFSCRNPNPNIPKKKDRY